MPRLNAHELVDIVLDEGSFRSWDAAPIRPAGGISETYAAELAAAADKSGVDEAVITGEGTISGRRVAVVVGEFRFLAGSIGVAAAERLVDAIERDRKSTRLNSSHVAISYAVFCLKTKKYIND